MGVWDTLQGFYRAYIGITEKWKLLFRAEGDI